MLFPIGDDQVKGGSFPIFSYGFILLNILIFLYQLSNPNFTYGFSTVPYEITNGVDLIEAQALNIAGQTQNIPQEPGPFPIYLTLISSMFMHGGWMHLIGNMMFLWVFADNIESTVGNVRFLIFYLLGGLAASLGHILTDVSSIIPSLGASGAIAACLGAYLVMFPKSRIKMLFFIKIFTIPAFLFLGFWIVQQLFNGFGSLGIEGSTGVAWFAHIGGFVFGVIAGFFFKGQYPKIKHVEKEYQPVKTLPKRYNNRPITTKFDDWNM